MSSKSNTAEIETQIGERIRARRIQVGMSQILLGQALGVTFQQVQKYEKGTNRVSAGRLLKISEVLECDVMDFFEGIRGDRPSYAAEFSSFLSTKDGVAIVAAMLKIKTQDLRRTVIDIAEKLGQSEPETMADRETT
jgi:transcriptional regulator with XRE-family HTH domain